MIDFAKLHETVRLFDPGADFAAGKSRELVLGLIEHTPNPLSRDQFEPGHLTCTGLVLHPNQDAILLIHHRRLNRWLLPGGHVEDRDDFPWQTAYREVTEETTVELHGVPGDLVGIDVHGIPPKKQEPFHLHHDLVFCFQAQSVVLRPSEDEVHDAIWYHTREFATNSLQIPKNILLCAYRAMLPRPLKS